MSFMCTRILYDNVGPRYISSKNDLENVLGNDVLLRCYIDDFFMAVKELKYIPFKVVKYIVKINERVKIDGYDNLFDVFGKLKKYSDCVLEIELNLFSKVNDSDFNKLYSFLSGINQDFKLTMKLGNLEVFSLEQLALLEDFKDKFDLKLKINQSYEGKERENNDYDNIYTIDKLIIIKKKIYSIVNNVPDDYNDLEKVLFVYLYLGRNIDYDEEIAILDYEYRNCADSNSIYNVLFNNRGVCSSFSVTFRVLMNAIGVECQVVSSIDHEWNVVKINGYWYHLDLTADLYNIKYDLMLEYFLKSEKFMLKDDSHQLCSFYSSYDEIANRSISSKRYVRKLVNKF